MSHEAIPEAWQGIEERDGRCRHCGRHTCHDENTCDEAYRARTTCLCGARIEENSGRCKKCFDESVARTVAWAERVHQEYAEKNAAILRAREGKKPEKREERTMLLTDGRDQAKDFEPAPQGTHLACCVDFVDIGIQPVSDGHGGFKEYHRCWVVWQVEPTMEDGRHFLVRQEYTASLYEKAKLCQHLEAWRDRPFTEHEKEGFESENLVGVWCNLVVVHNKSHKGDRVFANVNGIMKKLPGQQEFELSEYTRYKDRTDDEGNAWTPPKRTIPDAPAAPQPEEPGDDNVPF